MTAGESQGGRSASWRRRLVRVAAGSAVLLVLLLVALHLWIRSASPARSGELTVAGVDAEIRIWRDALGIPHIVAVSEHDLLFAQGFVHAQDRLWQMELVRRVAQGRLAEILGAGLVDSDRFLRTLGLWRAAGDQERALDDATRASFDAYVAGINAFLSTRRGALPPEFLALGFAPEPWTVRHSLALEKVMAWDLALYAIAAEQSRAVRLLGPERARHLMPDVQQATPTILEAAEIPSIPEIAATLLEASSVTRASNAWVIAGSRTRSGKPILANDMHLPLRAPSIWYLMALHGGPVHVAGMSLPGAPFVVAGHNRAVAWGFTNASLDDADFFRIRLDPDDRSRYLYGDASERFRTVPETIRVRGGEPVVTAVRLTRHGPVMSLFEDAAEDELIALRWAGHDPSRTFLALPAFNRARSAEDVLEAIALFDNPHQNVVFADTAGRIGYAMGGRIPQRGDDREPPVLPVPGWTDEWEWRGYLPFERHPAVLDPSQGYVVTANNRQAAGGEASTISSSWEMPFRARRIREMVREGSALDADAVHAMQLDVRDALAEDYRPHAVEAAAAAGLEENARLLAAWDLRADPASAAAPLFYAWYESLRTRLRHDLYEGGPAGWFPREAVNAVLDARSIPWHEAAASATFADLARAAALAADSIVRNRTWGEVHKVAAEHALASSALLRGLLGLNLGPDAAPGSSTTVNVSHFGGSTWPAISTIGVSQRHVVDLGNIDGAGGFIIPTGQSGLPFERGYRDQWRRWRDGGLWPVPLDTVQAIRDAVDVLLLRPAAPPR